MHKDPLLCITLTNAQISLLFNCYLYVFYSNTDSLQILAVSVNFKPSVPVQIFVYYLLQMFMHSILKANNHAKFPLPQAMKWKIVLIKDEHF